MQKKRNPDFRKRKEGERNNTKVGKWREKERKHKWEKEKTTKKWKRGKD